MDSLRLIKSENEKPITIIESGGAKWNIDLHRGISRMRNTPKTVGRWPTEPLLTSLMHTHHESCGFQPISVIFQWWLSSFSLEIVTSIHKAREKRPARQAIEHGNLSTQIRLTIQRTILNKFRAKAHVNEVLTFRDNQKMVTEECIQGKQNSGNILPRHDRNGGKNIQSTFVSYYPSKETRK